MEGNGLPLSSNTCNHFLDFLPQKKSIKVLLPLNLRVIPYRTVLETKRQARHRCVPKSEKDIIKAL